MSVRIGYAGKEGTADINSLEMPRDVALDVLNRVQEGAWAAELLQRRLGASRLDDTDRRFATELVYGTLRRRGELDFVLGRFCDQPLDRLDPPVRNILRMGAYQVMYMRVPSYAACSESVSLMKRTGPRRASGLVNGVLRSLVRGLDDIPYPDREAEPARWLSVKESHPLWMIERWVADMGFEETLALCRSNNEPAPLQLRVNTLRTCKGELMGLMNDEGRRVTRCRLAPHGLNYEGGGSPFDGSEYREGLFSAQSEGSQLAVLSLGVRPGMRILDACAGRGGKTAYIAELMGEDGEIVAVDIHSFKLDVLKREVQRLGLNQVQTLAADATRLPADIGRFDLVLVDAPCSGVGVLRRYPEARWQKGPQLLDRMPRLQGEILSSVASVVRPGGRLVYCTCSLFASENEDVVLDFLRGHEDFDHDDFPAEFPDLKGSSRGMVQLLPHVHGTDGFFISGLRRRGGVKTDEP